MNNGSNTTAWVIGIIIVLIVIVGGWWLVTMNSQPASSTTTGAPNVPAQTTGATTGAGATTNY